jgi:acyl-homoserine-lactone acylase
MSRFSTRLTVGATLASGLIATFAATFLQAQTPRYSAEIRRTSFGVPHIKANDYGSLGYGLAYSFAEDNVCVLAEEVVTINGQRSRFFGPDGTNQYGYRNLALDFVMRFATDDTEALRARFNEQPADVQALIRGYIAGYNRFLTDRGVANLPEACRNQPWVRAIDEVDFQKLIRRFTMESSYFPFLEGLVAARPPAATSDPVAGAPVEKSDTGEWHGVIDPQTPYAYDREHWLKTRDFLGSNALAVGKDGVESGRSLLLGTPHFPWFGMLRFYQMHLTIPGVVDVMGASLFGAPIVNIGFNNNVAWSHTNDKAWHFTLYQLQLVPGRPTVYRYNGEERALTTRNITVDVRNTDGTISQRTQTFYSSHFGPMVVSNALPIPWTAANGYAMKDANANNFRLIEQWYRMNRATSVAELHAVLKEVIGIPWVNTTAIDREGNAFYGDIAAIPNMERRQFAGCVPDVTFAVVFAFNGPPVVRGNDSSCEWIKTGEGIKSELIPGEKMPFIVRSDFAHNSNDSYILANPAQPLFDVNLSPILGVIEPQNLRTRIGLSQALARLQGRDGLAGNKFNMRNLQQLALSNRSLAAEIYLDDMLTACRTSTMPDVVRGCRALAGWDRRYELASTGGQVFLEVISRISANLEAFARVPWDITQPLTTPAGLNVASATVAAAVNTAIDASVKALDALGVTPDAQWGRVNVAVRGMNFIPIHGATGTSLGVYNAVNVTRVPRLGYTPVTGTSWIQTVQFNESGAPIVEGFLTYSQSTDPASPWFGDQTARFSAKNWIRYPFTDAEIAADPNVRTRTLTN